MSKLNYTQGEWKAYGRCVLYNSSYEESSNEYICSCYAAPNWDEEADEEAEANAILISAAPNMRDALESLVENIISGEGGCDFIKKENLDKAIAALKKANGEKC